MQVFTFTFNVTNNGRTVATDETLSVFGTTEELARVGFRNMENISAGYVRRTEGGALAWLETSVRALTGAEVAELF